MDGAVSRSMQEVEIMEQEADALRFEVDALENRLIESLEAGAKRAVVDDLEREIAEKVERREGLVAVSAARRREQKLREIDNRPSSRGGRGDDLSGFSIIYSSRFGQGLALDDISMIKRTSVTRNLRTGITGALLFSVSAGVFIQILEGPKAAVTKLYKDICSDSRHKDVVLVRQEVMQTRRFPESPLHAVDLQDHDDRHSRPLQTCLALLVQQNTIGNAAMPRLMRDVIVRGGNPLYLQPKRSSMIVVKVTLHGIAAFGSLAISETPVSDTFNTFLDVAVRCLMAHRGQVVTTGVGTVIAKWGCDDIKRVRVAVTSLAEAFDELRSLSLFPGEDVAEEDCHSVPQLALCAEVYPCIAVASGVGMLMKQSTFAEVVLQVVGPVVSDVEKLTEAGLLERRQLVASRTIVNTLGFSKRFTAVELPQCPGEGYSLLEVGEVPPDLPTRIAAVVQLMVQHHILEPPATGPDNETGQPVAVEDERIDDPESDDDDASPSFVVSNRTHTAETRSNLAFEPNLKQIDAPPLTDARTAGVLLTEEELHA
eukprot:gene6084-9346_t